MKKTIILISALSVLLLTFACNQSTERGQIENEDKQDTNVIVNNNTEEQPTTTTTTEETKAEGKVIKLDNASFRKLIHDYKSNPKWNFKGELPCIIDFYADWCAPCRIVSPILDELAQEYAGKINIYKVDTEKDGELSNFYGIQYLPTLMFCTKTGEPTKQVGAFTKADYKSMIEKDLLK